MRTFLYLLLAVCICGCAKKEIEDVQADSFRVSILPVINTTFNQYQFAGTLEVRHATGDIEYGLVAGKALNPDVDRDKVFKTGVGSGSVDFSQVISGLDTGAVYYVRAYAKSQTVTQYSANQTIAKLSPKIYLNSTVLQYGQVFTFSTNFGPTGTGILPVVRLNNTVISATGGGANGGTAMVLTLVPSENLPVGPYTLSVDMDGVKVTYPTQLTLLEGHWTQPYLLPRNYSSYTIFDRYVIGNWIYSSEYHLGTTGPTFTRYNYKTSETQNLATLSSQQIVQGAALYQNGNELHVLGGELIGTGSVSRPMSNVHWIYNIQNDAWVRQQPDLPGKGRRNAALLQVGTKLYYGLGSDATTSSSGYFSGLDDLWVFDPGTGQWQQLANFPGIGKYSRAYFDLGGKLYVVGGNSDQGTAVKECWSYDPSTNQWSLRAPYPGSGWINLLAFSLGNNGYTGTGETSSYNSYTGRNVYSNMYKYDSINDKWTEVSNFGGNVIQPFVGNLGTSILVGAGLDAGSVASRYIFEFKP